MNVDNVFDVDSAADALAAKWEQPADEDGGDSLPESEEEARGEREDHTPEQDDESQQSEEGDTMDEEGEDGEEGDDESADDEDSDDEGTDEEQEPSVASDDAKVTVEVNGESKEFTVGELKRLAGQEAALTQKSQEVAQQRQQFEEGLKVQRTALEAMMERAQKRFEPYKDFDFVLAAQQYDAETYKALKEDAQAAYSDVQFYQTELRNLIQNQDQQRQQRLNEAAQAALKELQDPDKGIPGFDRNMYTKIRDYAVANGIDGSDVDQMVHPAAWKILHKAMQYDQLQKAESGAKPIKKGPKKIVKTSKSASGAKASKQARSRQQYQDIASKSGLDSVEAAANALLSRWGE